MTTSRVLESYCVFIEALLKEGALRIALRSSIALPDVCSALENAELQGSRDQYIAWCAEWLTCDDVNRSKAIDGARLYRLYSGRLRLDRSRGNPDSPTDVALSYFRRARRARRVRGLARSLVWQPMNSLQAFQIRLSEALVDASRRWYGQRGAASATVQRNLGRLVVTG